MTSETPDNLNTNVWTIRTILDWTQQYFKEREIETPRLDAELLLSFVCQCSRMELYLAYDKPLLEKEREDYRKLVRERTEGVPIAYLLGEKGFWTLNLFVGEGVLIPRPDTETLVEAACTAIKERQFASEEQTCTILEIGTGTAAIPLALCSSLNHISITTVDISEQALQIAQKNVKRYEELLEPRSNSLNLVQGDRAGMFHDSTKFDFIISNPPYIRTSQISQLQREVAHHEPTQALDGGEDGLDFYHYFFNISINHLSNDGQILLEIGYDQAADLREILPESLELFQVVKDLQSHPRVFHVRQRTS